MFRAPEVLSGLEMDKAGTRKRSVALNLPNKLTVSRIIIIPLFVAALMLNRILSDPWAEMVGRWTALMLFIVATITDYLDGAIARARNLVTPFGQLFDPLADKLLTMSAFVCLVEIETGSGSPVLPAWAVILILGREFLVTGLRSLAASEGHVIQADKLGKHKTGWQLGGIIALLLGLAISSTLHYRLPGAHQHAMTFVMELLRDVVLISVLSLTVISGLEFLRKNRAIFSPAVDKVPD